MTGMAHEDLQEHGAISGSGTGMCEEHHGVCYICSEALWPLGRSGGPCVKRRWPGRQDEPCHIRSNFDSSILPSGWNLRPGPDSTADTYRLPRFAIMVPTETGSIQRFALCAMLRLMWIMIDLPIPSDPEDPLTPDTDI